MKANYCANRGRSVVIIQQRHTEKMVTRMDVTFIPVVPPKPPTEYTRDKLSIFYFHVRRQLSPQKTKINCQLFSLFEKKNLFHSERATHSNPVFFLFFVFFKCEMIVNWTVRNIKKRAEERTSSINTNLERWINLSRCCRHDRVFSSLQWLITAKKKKNKIKSRCFAPSRRYSIIKEWRLIKFKPGFCCPFSSALEGRCLKFLNNKIANHLC